MSVACNVLWSQGGVRCKVSYLIANFSNEAMEGMSESLETRSVFDLS